MGCAKQGFGTAPWGADSVAAPSAQVSTVASPTALAFDVGSKSFLQNTDGTMKSIHPVDQEVNLALGIEANKIGSAPDVGHKLRQILRAAGPTVEATARDEVNRVLARLVARKDIKLLGVDVDTRTVRGRIAVAVRYTNLRTASVQTAKVK